MGDLVGSTVASQQESSELDLSVGLACFPISCYVSVHAFKMCIF